VSVTERRRNDEVLIWLYDASPAWEPSARAERALRGYVRSAYGRDIQISLPPKPQPRLCVRKI
jgi:hypothetical protein